MAGSAAAWALAESGWQVQVVDAAGTPAAGASSLPAGLFGPLESADDNLVSQIVRAGVHRTMAHAQALLRHEIDWNASGVLTLKPGTAPRWTADAGWIRPSALVNAWLRHPSVTFSGGCRIEKLQDLGEWDRAPLVVLSAAQGCRDLVRRSLAFDPQQTGSLHLPPETQALAGQISWGSMCGLHEVLPRVPVNGQGHLLTGVPGLVPDGLGWLTGAGFEAPHALAQVEPLHRRNLDRLSALLPGAAKALSTELDQGRVREWQGVRCIGRTRLPLVQRLSSPGAPRQVWLCTGMGARGLSWAALCGELLAAAVNGGPLPLPPRLAHQLMGKPTSPLRPRRTSGP